MTEPHDNLDDWLQAEIQPMQPPPGTFDRVRKQARRRKARQVAISAVSAGTAAVVIVLAVVTLPRVVPKVLHPRPAAAGQSLTPPVSTGASPASSTASPLRSASKPASATPPVPPDFQATSVTFASLSTGWVIGQAAVGVAGYCQTGYCTSVARTDNSGKSWYGVKAPLTGGPDGSAGVSQIRFLNTEDGWAFGPALWVTRDGGSNWNPVALPAGTRVTSLETVGDEAFAVFATCSGTGTDYAADCTGFALYSSAAGSNAWTEVSGTSGYSTGAASSATVVLTHGVGYFYTPDGRVLTGATTAGASWQPAAATAAPCTPGAAAATGQPSGGQLAVSAPGDLTLACPGSQSSGSQFTNGSPEVIWTSTDGGQTWQRTGTAAVGGQVTSLATSTGGVMVLASTDGLYTSADGGVSWKQTQSGPSGGFSYAGLTSPRQGVAVPADASLHQIWFSYTAGQGWQASAVAGG